MGIDTLTGSDYLDYPTPIDFEAASDLQFRDSVDLRMIFGWVFPNQLMDGGMGGGGGGPDDGES